MALLFLVLLCMGLDLSRGGLLFFSCKVQKYTEKDENTSHEAFKYY